MSKKMKKLFIFLLMGIVAVTLVGCKDSYKYPSKTPMITDTSSTFIGAGNWKVTNEEAYLKLLNSYGYNALLEWVDGIIYENYSPTGFDDFLNEQIYGTSDLTELSRKEQKEKLEAWEEAMESAGYQSEDEWKAHYQIIFKRNKLTRSKIVELITEFEKVVNVLEGIDLPLYVTEDFDLLTKDENVDKDLEVTWTSNSSYVVIKKNKAVVTRGKYDVEVTLTAVAKIGDDSTSATYVFTVPAISNNSFTTGEKAEKTVTGYFAETNYESYLNSEYKPDVTTAIVTFDSDAEAKSLLKKYGVDVLKLNGQKWVKSDGTEMTEAEVKNVFVALYNETKNQNATSFDDITKDYTSKELAEFNSTISTKVYSMKALNNLDAEEGEDYHKCYTVVPTLFGSKFFLAFNASMGEEVELDSVRAEIKEKLIDAQVATAQINRYAMENILEKGTLHIYSEGLENAFVSNYASIYSALSITDYDSYTRTKGESDKHVASYEYDGTTYNLTADDLFASLVKSYGASLAVSYFNQYIVLEHSEIIDFVTHEVLDKDAYDEIYKTAVKTYKDNFKKDSYKAAGYPKSYGWKNFMRDYLGITDEFQLIVANGGTVYTKALDEYKKTLYVHETVSAEAEKIFNDYFNAAVYSVSAYVDKDDDGNSDNLVMEGLDSDDIMDFNNLTIDEFWTKYGEKYESYEITKAELAEAKETLAYNNSASDEFVSFLSDIVELSFAKNQSEAADKMITSYYSTASESNKQAIKTALINIANAIAEDNETSRSRFAELTTYYAISTPNDLVFGSFKQNALQVNISTSTTYTNSSSLDDYFKEEIKALYDEGINYQAAYFSREETVTTDDGETKVMNSYVYGTDITGETLDPFYTYTKKADDVNSDTYTVRPFNSENFFNKDRMTKIFVTTISDRTKISKTVTDLLNSEGEIVYDEDGAPVQYVKYNALEVLTEDNYKDYLLDSDGDDDTDSSLTTSQKSVITAYYVAAINNLTADYADKIINKQLALIDQASVTINSNFSYLEGNIIKLLNNNLSEE